MNVSIKQIEGITFIGKGETNHWVTMDGPKQFNGSEAGSRPMELLLLSLGSCSASDVVSILTKKRVSFDQLEIHVTGDREDTHPKVFTKIHLEYVFYGNNLPDQDLQRAIDLSQNKYCPIVAMLRKSCEITHSYRIEGKND